MHTGSAAAALALAVATFAQAVRADAVKDEPSTQRQEQEDRSKNPLAGSRFIFDQSATTQTAQLEGTSPQQSYVPLYEWWLSLRPRYHLSEHVYVWGRFDYYKELTNNQPTTDYREDVFGDIWTSAGYEAFVDAKKRTKLDAGVRMLWPTSKQSQADGIYVNAGLTGAATHRIPLRPKSDWFGEARVGVSGWYTHPFARATTPSSYGGFGYVRQDVEGRSFVSDQLRGQTLVNHQLTFIASGGVDITKRVSASLDMVLINQWHYAPTGDVSVPIQGGAFVPVPRSADDHQFTQSTWLVASAEWQVMDELSLTLGYYNLANVIAPDGQRRGIFGGDNVWWSPDARVFFDVTAHLDRIFEDVTRKRTTP